jgi:uncharacterized protein (TIGR02246 family)
MTATAAEAEVVAAFEALETALCRQRNGEAAARLFVDEDDAMMWGSAPDEVAVGKAAIGELFRALTAANCEPFAFRWDVRKVRVEGDVAWVNAVGEWVDESSGRRETGPYRVSAVLLRRDGAWRWHTFTGSEPSPA